MLTVPQIKAQRTEIPVDPSLRLRPLHPDDVTQRYADALNDPEVNRYLLGPRAAPQDLESTTAFVRQNFNAPDSILFGIFDDQVHCGNIRVHDIGTDTAFIGIALFDKTRWHRGIGHRCIRRVADFCLEEMALTRIRAGIDRENNRSISAFTRAGFRLVSGDEFDGAKEDCDMWCYP